MAMTVTYTTFNGQIVYENRNGTQSFYAPDTLGSTAMLLDTTGTVTDTFTYWPYGEIQEHVGSSVTPFTFVGTLGYYLDIAGSLTYIRARHYLQALCRWLTVDPLWPWRVPYGYCDYAPELVVDPAGRQGIVFDPGDPPLTPVLPVLGGCAQDIWNWCKSAAGAAGGWAYRQLCTGANKAQRGLNNASNRIERVINRHTPHLPKPDCPQLPGLMQSPCSLVCQMMTQDPGQVQGYNIAAMCASCCSLLHPSQGDDNDYVKCYSDCFHAVQSGRDYGDLPCKCKGH